MEVGFEQFKETVPHQVPEFAIYANLIAAEVVPVHGDVPHFEHHAENLHGMKL